MLADAPRYDYSDTTSEAPEEHITQDQARGFLSSLGKVIT